MNERILVDRAQLRCLKVVMGWIEERVWRARGAESEVVSDRRHQLEQRRVSLRHVVSSREERVWVSPLPRAPFKVVCQRVPARGRDFGVALAVEARVEQWARVSAFRGPDLPKVDQGVRTGRNVG